MAKAYDSSVFYRGQRYRAEVIEILRSNRIDFYCLPAEVNVDEVVRHCFY